MAEEVKKSFTEEEITNLEALVESYLSLQIQMDELGKQLDAAKEKLKEAVRASEEKKIVLPSKHSISLSSRTRTTISYKLFAEAHPRLAKKFANTTPYDVLTVK